jgi:hypothetical protein
LRDPENRNTYMKRLNKSTKYLGDNLLNFQKKTEIPIKLLLKSKLSKCLKSRQAFLCLSVPEIEKDVFFKNYLFHVHLRPSKTIKTVG